MKPDVAGTRTITLSRKIYAANYNYKKYVTHVQPALIPLQIWEYLSIQNTVFITTWAM
jgi:hypothetical protein